MTCNAYRVSSKRERLEAAGRWLRRTREQRGYATLGEFARALGVDPSLISRYERGVSEISDERAEQIAKILRIDLLEVRRSLGLWVPDDSTAGEATGPEPATRDELIARANELMGEAQEYLRRARETG